MKYTTLLFLFLVTFAANAQNTIGLKSGIQLANRSIDSEGFDLEPSYIVGFNQAFFGNFRLTDYFSLQPEVRFVQRGSKFKEFQFGALSVETTTRISQLEFTLLGNVFKRLNKLEVFLQAGPYWGYALDGFIEDPFTQTGLAFSSTYRRFDMGMNVGAGLGYYIKDYLLFTDVSYQQGLINLSDNKESPVSQSIRNKGISIRIGIGIPISSAD